MFPICYCLQRLPWVHEGKRWVYGWVSGWVFSLRENRGVQQIDRVSERRHREYVLWNDQAHCPLSWVMCQAKPITTSLAMHPTLRSGVGDYVIFPWMVSPFPHYVLWNGQAPAHYVMYNNKQGQGQSIVLKRLGNSLKSRVPSDGWFSLKNFASRMAECSWNMDEYV